MDKLALPPDTSPPKKSLPFPKITKRRHTCINVRTPSHQRGKVHCSI